MSGSRGEANFVWKCKMCKVSQRDSCRRTDANGLQRESSATIKSPPIAYTQASPPTRQKILEFDCRGLEFTEFKPEVRSSTLRECKNAHKCQGEWLATGLETGTKFTAIDLVEGEWYDYDDKASEEVSIKDLKFEIRRN